MRIFFAGTPDFSNSILRALINANHQVVGVLCQPDRPSGRHLQLQACPVKMTAQQHSIPVWQPQNLRLNGKFSIEAQAVHEAIKRTRAELLIVVAYGLILPQSLLDLVPALNIHASLLPRWRGAAPIQRAIQAGDAETGIALMQMDAGLDTGPVWRQIALPIQSDDTTQTLHDALVQLGVRSLLDFLPHLHNSTAIPQDTAGITYAEKITKTEAQLDFALPAENLARCVRAFNPAPGAFFMNQGQVIKVWQSCFDDAQHGGVAGTILGLEDKVLWIACGTTGRGRLGLMTLQRAGGKRLAAIDFLRGYQFQTPTIAQD